jgi:hypothetical protein
MAGQQITIRLEGSPGDAGHLRLGELIQQLEFVRSALKKTERIVSGKEGLLYYRVTDLSHSSPASITLEPATIKSEIDPRILTSTVERFFGNLNDIKSTGNAADDVDLSALEAYRDLGALLSKNVSKVSIANGSSSIEINQQFREKVNEIIGPDELIEGSLSGMLEWLNIHNTSVFHIYPETGPKKVNCSFSREKKPEVIAAIDRHVRVYGMLRYKKRDKFAYAADVEEIEVLPLNDELPTLASLRGIAQNVTGMSAADFIRSIRDASQ